jgi:uncharacterized membrane protein
MTGSVAHVFMAALLFVGAHFALSSQPLRQVLSTRLGERPFLAIYTLVALASFAWLLLAYAHAPYIGLWPPSAWTRWIPFCVMPFAMILLVSGYLVRNPTVVGQERLLASTDPAPGILKITRHPAMWAMALWGLSHIPANGDAASLVLFVSITVLALGGAAHIDRRRRAAYPQEWQRFAAVTSYVPFAAIASGRNQVALRDIGWVGPLLGFIVFVAFLFAHKWFIGVPAWPL